MEIGIVATTAHAPRWPSTAVGAHARAWLLNRTAAAAAAPAYDSDQNRSLGENKPRAGQADRSRSCESRIVVAIDDFDLGG